MDKVLQYSVDRIVENVVVLEDAEGAIINVPLSDVPQNVTAGDVLRLMDGRYVFDDVATESRRQRIFELQKRLRNK